MTVRFLLILFSFVSIAASPLSARDWDLDSAMKYCDSDMRYPLEGIWRSTSEDHSYFIIRDGNLTTPEGCYTIYLVQDDNGFIRPGTNYGTLSITTDTSRFLAKMGKGKRKKQLAATVSKDNNYLSLEGDKLDVSLNPLTFVPYIRRLLNLRLKRPAKELPKGLVRIYPRPFSTPIKL